DKVSVPEKFVVTFKPGKEMEERVRSMSSDADVPSESPAPEAASPQPSTPPAPQPGSNNPYPPSPPGAG
ncbi:MAG: integration host factor subunit beta, partial [Planctomycetota bacterium]